ncbi:Guanosine-diphosphatase [Coemansia spiralis]|uniref:guanosine-diphosphatase n=2 Tax=Coemansia TaxID=4863 RepID=A0A9W8KXD6_9FUNG|nr:nucleoside phosphatase family-domain-containing protein [Coemansia spiralis]KAJ1992981.1 Guanosine-diphosphatase [Coemansia umbellata]KAJ2622860.1 Guanosine-diphosphatase [Coemansia sp. RSA 1358]KAJ2678224.1 Guanosine-diphosphatase [Coemansia spiralis]
MSPLPSSADSDSGKPHSKTASPQPRSQAIQRRATQHSSASAHSRATADPTHTRISSPLSSRRQTPSARAAPPQAASDPPNSTVHEVRIASRSAEPPSAQAQMFRDAVSSATGVLAPSDAYSGLGQYPGKRSRFAIKPWMRLALILTAVFGLAYFGIAGLRSSSAFSGLGGSAARAKAVDPRLQSAHCDVPHPGRPLVQYVLMIDAGSTGSRIHVYKFNYCKSHPELEGEVFEQLKPGLSSFGEDAQGAAHSLDGLLRVAMDGVPESLRPCTPVAVKATAGLRMLGAEKSGRILSAVEDRLAHAYPFRLVPDRAVEIMDGRDEGIYAWITVNYLLGTLGTPAHKTAATFDLGGGSTQIVFEPRLEAWDSSAPGGPQMAPGEHRYQMGYGGENYTLYQHSYLGYGLMEARKKIKALIAQDASNSGRFSVEHPCFPPGFREEVATNDGKSQVTIKGKEALGSGAASDACLSSVRQILNKDAPCAQKPCSFNGVYQPALDKTFADNPFYIFSYFYDRTYPLGVRDEFKLSDVKALADKVCRHDVSLFALKPEQEEITAENHYCLDLSFQYALLRDGVGMAENRVVRSTRKIKDAETGWCLGASLAVLDQNRYCR